MPIIRVTTNVTRQARAKLARAGTDVFRSLGLTDEHITTVIDTVSGDDLFVAGDTFEERYGDARFVLATVFLGSKRGTDVRERLARALTQAVDGVVARNNVSVDFVIRDAGDVYIGGVALGSAAFDASLLPREQVDGAEVDQRLRILLNQVWKVGSTVWAATTPLAALRCDTIEWDSVAAIELAVTITNNLGLTSDLDVGEEEVRTGLGYEATYADLLDLVRARA